MGYTVKEVSEMIGLPISTLRYYDKMGLLPGLQRKESGYRVFSEDDIEMLKIINSFKQAGFQIKDIQRYVALALQGDGTLQERYDIFLKQEQVLNKKMQALQTAMEVTQKKLAYYREAIEKGADVLPKAFCLK